MRTPEQHSAISDGCFKKERTFFELQVHLHLYMMYFDCIHVYTNTQWIGLIHIISLYWLAIQNKPMHWIAAIDVHKIQAIKHTVSNSSK